MNPKDKEETYEHENDDYTAERAGLSVFDIASIEGIDLEDYVRDLENKSSW